MSGEVDHVVISHDENWDTFFIPWLENLEKNGIGVEDGVFVATVDPQIRTLQPDDEADFVRKCVKDNLFSLSGQKLKKFPAGDLYHLGSGSVSLKQYEDFKKRATDIQFYRDNSCCSEILQDNNGLACLLQHIFSVIDENALPAGRGESIVLLDETAMGLRKKHENYSQSTDDFLWESGKKAATMCPATECIGASDSAESDFEDDSDNIEQEQRLPKLCTADTEYKSIYGYSTTSAHQHLKITPKLNLSRIYNILWLIPNFYPGLHSTYLYFGEPHALFSVHIEDGLTWSLNYLYVGHPKVWVIIPPWATDLLDFHLHKNGFLIHSHCRNLLGHKVLFPTTNWLKERSIPFKIVIQNPGDLVVLHPNTAHYGFNMGHNIAQAVNIATKSWIPFGLNAKKCPCYLKSVHLDMVPLVAAFREDLLPAVLKGQPVLPSQLTRGLKLMHDEVTKANGIDPDPKASTGYSTKKSKTDDECIECTLKCPAPQCPAVFVSNHKTKSAIIRHVKANHRPILKSNQLLQKIEELF